MELHYFPIRGLGEIIRLTLSYVQAEYTEHMIDFAKMKSDLDAYPFGQCPRLVDGDFSLTQSCAIVRYLGRKFDCYGSNDLERARIDVVMDAVLALRMKYLELIYTFQLADDKKKGHWSTHGDPAGTTMRNGGAHWTYMNTLLKNSAAHGSGPVVGDKLTIADVVLAELTSLYVRIFETEMKAKHPEVIQHMEYVYGNEHIKAYIDSGKQPEKINYNGLG